MALPPEERALIEAVDRGWGGMQYSAHVQVQEEKAGADLEPKGPTGPA